MAKKMTAKEFWGILESAGVCSSKNFEDILNALVGHEFKREETHRQLGFEASAKACNRKANFIYDALDARGYYNDVK